MAAPGSARRRTRERELVAATRALFDERGFHDVPIEEIARAVGIPRGNIYRQFSSKEELFTLAVTTYLDELAPLLGAAVESEPEPAAALERCVEAFAGFCVRYPAFLDSSIFLMHRPARELEEMVAGNVWFRLGQGMAACLGRLSGVLRRLGLDEPEYMANVLWTQAIGVMHLARIRVGVQERAPGIPGLFALDVDRVVRTCVEVTLASAGVRR